MNDVLQESNIIELKASLSGKCKKWAAPQVTPQVDPQVVITYRERR